MLTHIVLISLAPDATDDQVDAMVAGLEGLPAQIDAIGTYQVGRDLGLFPGNAGVSVVATFADADAVRTYIDHPAHQQVVRDLIQPISDTRLRTQFTTPEA